MPKPPQRADNDDPQYQSDMRRYFSAPHLDYFFARYSTGKTDMSVGANKQHLLVDSIIPSDRFAISGMGAQVLTDHGTLIDFQSMTVNCILGQNDPWIKIQQIGINRSQRQANAKWAARRLCVQLGMFARLHGFIKFPAKIKGYPFIHKMRGMLRSRWFPLLRLRS